MSGATRERIVAVIPLFEPTVDAAAGIRAAGSQVDAVVLVDDGSPTDTRPFVASLGLHFVRLERSPINSGIAHALNRGTEIALDEMDADLVLTLDQDSVLDADYVVRATRAMADLRLAGVPFAAVAAGTVNGRQNRGEQLEGLPFRLTRETIQSGMIIPRPVVDVLGPFDESFFIDCVDTDYILRGWSQGLPTVIVPACSMRHSMGDGIRVRIPFLSRRREYVVPYHRPDRRYYITRNRVRLLARHARNAPGWALRQSYEQAKYAALDLLWGPEKLGQLRATAVGLVDGLAGRGGALRARARSTSDRSHGRGTAVVGG